MKKLSLCLILVLALLMAGCIPTPTPTTAPTVPVTPSPQLPTPVPATPVPLLTAESLQNGTYSVPRYQKVVTLTNGKYESGSGDNYLMVTLLPQIALGDLNGDGTTDAAILLSENGGGSGQFVSLIVILDQNSSLVQLASSVLIDDRPVIQSLAIQDASIILKALIHGPNDPMVSPTFAVNETYRLGQGKLWLSRLASTFQGGSENSITIESPAFGSEVSQSVEVKGSMPIGPFENTLGYIITDDLENTLTSGSFLVTNTDLGTPSTFDQTLDLTGIPAGTLIRIKVFETDMSGQNQYVALDSVELTVR